MRAVDRVERGAEPWDCGGESSGCCWSGSAHTPVGGSLDPRAPPERSPVRGVDARSLEDDEVPVADEEEAFGSGGKE